MDGTEAGAGTGQIDNTWTPTPDPTMSLAGRLYNKWYCEFLREKNELGALTEATTYPRVELIDWICSGVPMNNDHNGNTAANVNLPETGTLFFHLEPEVVVDKRISWLIIRDSGKTVGLNCLTIDIYQ